MPLVRFRVKNEYGLGDRDLCTGGADKDDPKSLLESVAVAGLVGILRQLGDLAEFAAEVFHDLHEQVTSTAARSQKVMIRVRHIEAALPPIEKAVLAQTSHIHFAYTAGSDWHADIRTNQNHLIHSDLPQFIMDPYEECRDPPRLFLLDKFDTAGPGACLRRYSDPSFFKIAWASSELMKEEKVQRENKSHKFKKNKLRQRSRKVPHALSMPRHSHRTQFASPDTDGQSFPADTIATSDVRSNSELENRSTLVDSKTRSSFIQQGFDVNSPMSTEELENSESSTSKLKMQFSDAGPYVLTEEQNGEGTENNSRYESLEGQSGPGFSVTWDEKTEIVKPTILLHDSICEDLVQAAESPSINFDLYKLEQRDDRLENIDQEDILFDVENIPDSFASVNHLDEVTSETDNYMDALNTMESEIDTDSECQTKREVELQSNVKNQVEPRSDRVHEMAPLNSDLSDVEFPIASSSSSNKEMSQNFSESVSSDGSAHEQPPEVTGMASNLESDTGFCGTLDLPNVSSENSLRSVDSKVISDYSIPNLQTLSDSKLTVISGSSQESHTAEVSDEPSVTFWTNGGLLGVQPSKPPDFSVSNVESQNSTPHAKNELCDISSGTSIPKLHDDGSVGNLDPLVNPIEKVPSCVEEKDGLPINHSPGAEFQSISNNEVSSNKSGFSNRFLGNGFQRKASLVQGEASKPSTIVNADPQKLQARPSHNEQTKWQNGVGSQISHEPPPKNHVESGSPADSVSSKSSYRDHPSPPLEHMKISFHPINGLENSKLKLEFHESIKSAMFPSFQLLPELAIPLRDTGYESDDDTFCKSSSYLSDDMLSPHSESNSEQWESGEANESEGHERYGELLRVSSTASISSSLESDRITHHNIHQDDEVRSSSDDNVIRSFQPDPSLDLPSFDSVNTLMGQLEVKNNSKSEDLLDSSLQHPQELPPPPPLPPLQWRITKLPFGLVEDDQLLISHGAKELNDLLDLGSISPQQLKPAAPKQPHTGAVECLEKSMRDGQQLNGQLELNQDANVKEMDEKDDFLHQIRTKSFSLRRTVPARPNFVPVPTTNINVTAILEKANAIRQAFVGSDEGGDDDNWSDS